jgi:predicted Rossmann fold nucleotide-binding protein DprA/Smf involved in DNA uptake
LVTCADDVVKQVLRVVDPMPLHLRSASEAGPDWAEIIDLSTPRSVTTAEVASQLGVTVEVANATLHLMERQSVIRRTPKGWRRNSALS